MKKLFIGAVVVALILFIWQFLSFGLLDLHGSQMDYHSNQDTVLEVLETNLNEGTYFMPRPPRGASAEEQESFYENRLGQPWARISYHESLEFNTGMSIVRGLLLDLAAALILCWILMNIQGINMKTAVLSSVGVGLMGYLTITYLSSVYFPMNTWPDLIDAIVPWGLSGVWLGWWLNR